VGRDEETKKKRKEETKRKEKMKVNKLHLAPRITRTRIHSKKGTAPEGGKGCSSLFALSLTFTFSLFLSFFPSLLLLSGQAWPSRLPGTDARTKNRVRETKRTRHPPTRVRPCVWTQERAHLHVDTDSACVVSTQPNNTLPRSLSHPKIHFVPDLALSSIITLAFILPTAPRLLLLASPNLFLFLLLLSSGVCAFIGGATLVLVYPTQDHRHPLEPRRLSLLWQILEARHLPPRLLL